MSESTVHSRGGAVTKARDVAPGEVHVGTAGSSQEKPPAVNSGARRLRAWQPLACLRSSISELSLNLPHNYLQIKREKGEKRLSIALP